MTASTRRELRSAATSTSTTAIGLIRALTDARPIKPTSTRCLSARPNPGRGSTYRRGNSVQTTAATSQPPRTTTAMPKIDDQHPETQREPQRSAEDILQPTPNIPQLGAALVTASAAMVSLSPHRLTASRAAA